MTTDNQKEQLKGYTQAVQEMSAVMAREKPKQGTSVYIAMEKLESKMREKVLQLVVAGQDDTS